jgi:DNA-directed RNA polymerase sigma subunit (sigma70/sigma32)
VALRRELQAIADALLAASRASRDVTLDAIGQAIGARAVTPVEIDELIATLEAAGRTITGPQGGAGEDKLKATVAAVRVLRPELGRAPTPAEIAGKSGLSEDDVRHALTLLKVMQR